MPRKTDHPGVSLMRVVVKGAKRWQLRWVDAHSGKRRTELLPANFTQLTATTAAIAQSQRLAQEAGRQRVSIERSIELFIEARTAEGKRPLTLRYHRTKLARVRPWLVSRWDDEVDADALRGLRAKILRAGWAPNTVNNTIASVRAWVNWLADGGRISMSRDDISRTLRAVAVDEGEPAILTAEQCRSVLRAALVHDASPRAHVALGAYVAVSLLTGCRPSEVERLRWEDVDLARGVLVVPRAKTRRYRYVDLSLCPSLLDLFAALPRANDWVWGVDVLPQRRVWWRQWLVEYGAPPTWQWEQLRRTCCTFVSMLRGPDVSRLRHGHTITTHERHYLSWHPVHPRARTLEQALCCATLLRRIVAAATAG